MFDFTKILVNQSEDETLERKQIVLYSSENSVINLLNSSGNTQLDNSLVDFIIENNQGNNSISAIEMNNFILVCIGTGELLNIKHRIWSAMAEVYNKFIKKAIVLVLEGNYSDDCVYGLVIKSYSHDFNKSKSKETLKIQCAGNERILEIANCQNFAKFLGDTPANQMTPVKMAEYLKAFFNPEKSIDFQSFDKNFIKNENMNLILSVSQGSSEEPVLVHAKYFGRPDNRIIDVAMVGKGVTFDTGGISLKPANEMFKLKQDMMGAAICAGVLKAAANLKFKINLSITLPLVENMPGSSATKPGDVFISKSGKSVEVDNTDAEGRLILADAITFAQKDNPKYLFDVATLTGAVRIALGNVYGGYFTNDEKLNSLIFDCGKSVGDPLWRLPLSPLIALNLPSHVADLSNASKVKAGAGASYAAEFIQEFVDSNVKWAHFDVSNVRNNHHLSSVFGDQTTARPLPSLLLLLEKLQGNN